MFLLPHMVISSILPQLWLTGSLTLSARFNCQSGLTVVKHFLLQTAHTKSIKEDFVYSNLKARKTIQIKTKVLIKSRCYDRLPQTFEQQCNIQIRKQIRQKNKNKS